MTDHHSPTLDEIIAVDPTGAQALLDEVADGCAGLVAQDIATDLLFLHDPTDAEINGDDVWDLIDEACKRAWAR